MRSLGWLLHLRCVPGSAQPLAAALARRTDTAWVQLLSGDTEVLCTVRGAAAERDAVLARLPRGGRIVAVSAHQLLHVYVAVTGGLGFLRALSRDQVAPLRQPVPVEKLRRDDTLEPGELDLALFREGWTHGPATPTSRRRWAGRSRPSGARWTSSANRGRCFTTWSLTCPRSGSARRPGCGCRCRPSELTATGAAFGEFPEAAYAAAVAGAFNLLACAVCRDEEEFYDFLTTRVGSLRAVDRVETSPIIRTLKQSSTVLAVFPAAGAPGRELRQVPEAM